MTTVATPAEGITEEAAIAAGKTERSPRQWLAGRLALLVAGVFGYATLIPDVPGARGA